jgi:hypothetical protein
MSETGGVVRETRAMIAGMAPRLLPGAVAFVCVPASEAATIAAALAEARALVREDEGVTLVLPADHRLVPEGALRMRQITLDVTSALDGVGLTAAVAAALAEMGIPCNVVAGARHDHLFVPEAEAEAARARLAARAAEAGVAEAGVAVAGLAEAGVAEGAGGEPEPVGPEAGGAAMGETADTGGAGPGHSRSGRAKTSDAAPGGGAA